MTIAEAQRIVNDIEADGRYLDLFGSLACLDATFSVDELEAIVVLLRHAGGEDTHAA